MKTFLLTGIASYTEACLLIVYESLEKFIEDYKDYHKRKLEALADLPFYTRINIENHPQWLKDIEFSTKKEEEWIKRQPINFEISTGTTYIKTGKGAGNFKDNIIIIEKKGGENYWLLKKIFNSDLPKGIHYYGDYCS